MWWFSFIYQPPHKLTNKLSLYAYIRRHRAQLQAEKQHNRMSCDLQMSHIKYECQYYGGVSIFHGLEAEPAMLYICITCNNLSHECTRHIHMRWELLTICKIRILRIVFVLSFLTFRLPAIYKHTQAQSCVCDHQWMLSIHWYAHFNILIQYICTTHLSHSAELNKK